jgi:hypothetical protein
MKNVGNADRTIRFIAAGILIVAGIFSSGVTRFVLWGVSLAPILTGIFRFCPVWIPFKINTLKNKR